MSNAGGRRYCFVPNRGYLEPDLAGREVIDIWRVLGQSVCV